MADEQATCISLPRQFPHEYNCWKCMRSRCTNPKNPSWRYYGEKGIKVCQRWLESFAEFLKDMGVAPTSEHQIDRLRNECDYEPSNCQWATPKEQAANTNKVVFVTYNGVTLSLADWSAILNINASTLRDRVASDWPSVEAFFSKTIDDSTVRDRRSKARRTAGVRHPVSGKFIG